MSKLSQRLRALRMERGLSQQALATTLGLSKSSVNMYERGEREPGVETLEALADLYQVDLDYLFGKSDLRRAGAQATEDSLKFALFGDVDVDDAVFEEVKRFARFAQEQHRK